MLEAAIAHHQLPKEAVEWHVDLRAASRARDHPLRAHDGADHALKLGGAPPSFPKRTLAPTSLPCGGLPSPVPRRLAGGR